MTTLVTLTTAVVVVPEVLTPEVLIPGLVVLTPDTLVAGGPVAGVVGLAGVVGFVGVTGVTGVAGAQCLFLSCTPPWPRSHGVSGN